MSEILASLRDRNVLPSAAYYFAQEATRQCEQPDDELLAHTAALLCTQSLSGNVCIDLHEHQGKPFFSDETETKYLIAPTVAKWKQALTGYSWVGQAGERQPMILSKDKLYLYRDWKNEDDIATRILEWCTPVSDINEDDLQHTLNQLFPAASSSDPDWQKIAVAMAVQRRFAVISGGPGTGKTTTVVKLLALLLELEPLTKIALATPTGKAAARLSESIAVGKEHITLATRDSIPSKAITLHRLLGYGNNRYRYNRDNPLPIDCLVIDEASMVDLTMMARVIDALPENSRLILIGDKDQLSSVEAGSVLGDITGQGCPVVYDQAQAKTLANLGCALPADVISHVPVPAISNSVALLRKTYRFNEVIGALANYCNDGNADDAFNCLKEDDTNHLSWIDAKNETLPQQCIDWAAEQYRPYLQCKNVDDALDAFEQARVLCATRQGPFGVEQVSRNIEKSLRKEPTGYRNNAYHGMPVLITRNDQELGLSNGDIGLVWQDEKSGTLKCFIRIQENDGNGRQQTVTRAYSLQQLPEYEPAYCLTVHKSQGSEYANVLLILPAQQSAILSRELIYTGITRTSKHLTLCSSEATFKNGCKVHTQRTSGLAEKLGWLKSTEND